MLNREAAGAPLKVLIAEEPYNSFSRYRHVHGLAIQL